jgi:hypothetical protein
MDRQELELLEQHNRKVRAFLDRTAEKMHTGPTKKNSGSVSEGMKRANQDSTEIYGEKILGNRRTS